MKDIRSEDSYPPKGARTTEPPLEKDLRVPQADRVTTHDSTVGSAQWRKQRPLARGVLDYFPDALLEVAYCSWVGNEQHNPGTPFHWDMSKSSDEADALLRHLGQRGTFDADKVRHSAKVAWRALALLQRELMGEKV